MKNLPIGRPLTVADLDLMPDDGHRYELINGALIVTPAPNVRHQIVLGALLWLLHDACPSHLRVLAAPLDVVLGENTAVQPDLLVAGREDFTEKNLPMAPMLAVEILSPNTHLVDLTLKKALYEEAGVASYWTVDPSVPRLVAWELHDGVLARVAEVSADEAWTATRPYAVTVVPSTLTH